MISNITVTKTTAKNVSNAPQISYMADKISVYGSDDSRDENSSMYSTYGSESNGNSSQSNNIEGEENSTPDKEDIEVIFPDDDTQLSNLKNEMSDIFDDTNTFLQYAVGKKSMTDDVKTLSSNTFNNLILTAIVAAIVIVFYFVLKKDE